MDCSAHGQVARAAFSPFANPGLKPRATNISPLPNGSQVYGLNSSLVPLKSGKILKPSNLKSSNLFKSLGKAKRLF